MDPKGIILNIKKSQETDKPFYDVQSRLNYYQQQEYYKNLSNNNNNIIQYPSAYNYYKNAGPKYYMARKNTLETISDNQMTNYPQPGMIRDWAPNNLMNKQNNYLNQISYQKPYYNQNYTLNYPQNNYNMYKNKQQKKYSELSLNLQELYPKELKKNEMQKPSQYSQNSTGVPLISNAINPSPVPFSKGPIPYNQMTKTPIPFSEKSDDFYSTPNPLYKNNYDLHNKTNNGNLKYSRGNKKSFNDTKKEITSEELDDLFDFNIGKELAPEPEFNIEKSKK